jgi:membrane-associated phospholipid phosphatase
VLFVPRPFEPLVAVAAPSSSSGLPSTFGLVYGAVFGVALLAGAGAGASGAWAALPARFLAAAAITAGSAARVVLGGHWPSQMLASLALGGLLALAALMLTARLAPIKNA